jgi:signal transduction histidine kinase
VIGVKLPAVLGRPVELAVAQRRVGELTRENARVVGQLATVQADLSDALDDLVVMRRELALFRAQRARLARALHDRSLLGLSEDLVALIEEEGLSE